MKIIHTSDLHLDSRLSTHLNSNVSKTRKEEILLSFNRLVEYASKENVKVIIIAGDMFDTKKVAQKTVNYIIKIIELNSNIDFIYLAGNHDEDNFISTLEKVPFNLKYFDNEWKSYKYDDVVITGINFNEITSKYMYQTLNLDGNKKNIVVLHGEVSNYNSSDKINLKLLENKCIDYLALGHIHESSINKLDDRGIYVYSGCLEGRGFDECGDKGFFVIDSNDLKNPTFIRNSKRIIHSIEVSLEGYKHFFDFQKDLFEKLNYISREDVVEVILIGKYTLSFDKNVSLLNILLNDKYYFAKVKDKSKLYINPIDYENDISLKSEFIKKVLASNNSDEDKQKIIEYGISALMGDDF